MAEIITSRDNEQVKYICKLMQSAQQRANDSRFAAEGAKLCCDLCSVMQPCLVFYTERAFEKNLWLKGCGGRHFIINDSVAKKISDVQTPQGVFCVFDMPQYDKPSITASTRLVALDAVQDPGNVGAIIRSAAAFGWDGVILNTECADVYSPKALRAGMSSTLKLPVFKTENLAKDVKNYIALGARVCAARLENSVEIQNVIPNGAFVLVIGSEGQGVSGAVAQACTDSVRIPIAPQMESLNAAVAAGVLMWNYRK